MIKVEDAISNLKYQILRFEDDTEPNLALKMAIEALEKKPVIVIQLDGLMSQDTVYRFREDMLKQMRDGLVVIPGYAHVAYVGEGCDIQIFENGE